MMKRLIPLTLLICMAFLPAQALHIVGGVIYYECLNASTHKYKITMKLYRDCQGGGAAYDNPAYVTIFDASGNLVQSLSMYNPQITKLKPNISNPCLVAPPNICVEEGIYVDSVTLPPKTGGYSIVYQRCCRNTTIANLANPSAQGATYTTYIPDTSLAKCNNNAVFNTFPPIVICDDEPINFDHSATDIDGDSLAYSLCTPKIGASQANPAPTMASSPPYTNVSYSSGYSATNPMTASPGVSIDPATGFITGIPTKTGQYVVGVCVEEYRNGVLINTTLRDFQFNVADCNKKVTAKIKNVQPDTLLIHCEDYTVTFSNFSQGANTYLWNFGVPGTLADTSNVKTPTYTFPDTGTYLVTLVANPYSNCSDTDQVYLKLYPFLHADFNYLANCEYDTASFISNSTFTGGKISSYLWSFGDGSMDSTDPARHKYAQEGTYNVNLKVTTTQGCVDDTTLSVTIHPQPDGNFANNFPCLDKPTQFSDLTTIPFDNIAQWKWFFDTLGTNNSQNPTFTFSDPGSYDITLITQSDAGCVDTFDKVLNIVSPPLAEVSPDTAVCYRGKVLLNASGGIIYNWSPADYLDDPTRPNPVARPLESITYTVKVADSCYWDTASIHVDIHPLPDLSIRSDTSVFRGDSVWIDAQGTGNNYSWFPQDHLSDPYNPNTFATPDETITYFLTTTDENGCQQTREITIYVRDVCEGFYAPNAFTPNGDGINDHFYMKSYEDFRIVRFQIFNRWGKLMFETENGESAWDGTFQGKKQPMDTYAYQVWVYCDDDIRHFSGNVTLIR